jgi:hypothetical protein
MPCIRRVEGKRNGGNSSIEAVDIIASRSVIVKGKYNKNFATAIGEWLWYNS